MTFEHWAIVGLIVALAGMAYQCLVLSAKYETEKERLVLEREQWRKDRDGYFDIIRAFLDDSTNEPKPAKTKAKRGLKKCGSQD